MPVVLTIRERGRGRYKKYELIRGFDVGGSSGPIPMECEGVFDTYMEASQARKEFLESLAKEPK
jgi:hypothetical protein